MRLLLVTRQLRLIIKLRARLLDVEPGRESLALAPIRQVQRILRGAHILELRRGESLCAAKLDIGQCDLALQHDEGIVGRLDLRLGSRLGLLHGSANLAEQVEFP